MARYIRRTVVLAKTETVYGTDPIPTGADNAVLVSNVSIQEQPNDVARNVIRGYLGADEMLSGDRSLQISLEVELQGSGAAGTAPAWGPLLRACGYAETVEATPDRVEYTLITDSMESVTIYYYDDGVLHKALGCRGTYQLKGGQGEKPVLAFTFTGLDGGATAAANPTPTLTDWKVPKVVTDSNSTSVYFGCTYAAGALSGGTEYPSKGVQLDGGNTVTFFPLLGGQTVEITQREITGDVSLSLTAAQEVSFRTDVLANTLTGFGFTHGTATGYKAMLFAPAVQRTEPSKADENGRRMNQYKLRLTPSSGNDELRIVLL